MRIAISGTHFTGKSTLIENFIKRHPYYKMEREPYYILQEEKALELSLEPTLDSLMEQMDYSIHQLHENSQKKNVIFDRCPVDFLAYALCALSEDSIDIHESEVGDRLQDIKAALAYLDMIVFLPISPGDRIDYTEENPAFRKTVDRYFKKIYREEIVDIFPRYNHPRIVELTGDPLALIKKLEYCLNGD